MKNTQNIILSILSIIICSCEKSDYSEAYVDSEKKIDLTASIEVSRSKAVAGSYVDFVVTMPQTFDTNGVLTVRLSNTTNEQYNIAKINIIPGQSSIEGSIKMLSNTSAPKKFEGTSNSAYLQVDGIQLYKEFAVIDDPYRMTSNKQYITLLDGSGAYDNAYCCDYDGDGNLEPWLSINLDWEGPYDVNDLDLFVVYEDGETYEDSQTGNRFEGDYFNGNWFPDGEYNIVVSPYKMGKEEIYARFTATDHNNKTTLFETKVSKNGGNQTIGKIIKSGGDSLEITYNILPNN